MPKKIIAKKKKRLPKWRKGDSCSSNPEKRTFREQARQSVHTYRKKTCSDLTASNIAKHNESLSDDDDDVMFDDDLNSEKTLSKSKSSFVTSISGLTDCTNITFCKVQNLWASPVEEHKQICAVLAAVTEVIRGNGGNETETEYFAALIVAVQNAQDEETKSAIIFLLSLVIKRVHPSVLQNRFPEASKILFEFLGECYQSGKTSLLKNLISCLSALLTNQDSSAWVHSSTTQIFQSILTLSVHQKPKVRKSAQSGICSILKMNVINNKNNPASAIVSKFCLESLRENQEDSLSSILHTLNLLKLVLGYLEPENIRKIAEEMLKLIRIGTMLVKTNCLQTVNNLFEACPSEKNLPASLNGKILLALYDLQPCVSDIQLSPAWLKVMESAHINLGISDKQSCLESLPKLFSSCMAYTLSDSKTVAKFAVDTMQAILEKCLLSIIDVTTSEPREEQQDYFHAIFRHVEQGLTFKYQPVWDLVLTLLASFFECLITICDFHESPDYPYLTELEKAVAAAIKSMGPKIFLKAVPLNLIRSDNKCEFPRSWLLPLMKDNIQDTELQYFISDLLPLAALLKEKGLVCSKNGNILEAKIFETLHHQIWALLLGFCKSPTDLQQAFKNIARILGQALTENPDIRHIVLLALRTITLKCSDSDAKEIANYCKNYLPILFNLYTSSVNDDENKLSLSVLETTKLLLNLADEKLVCNLLENARKKINDPLCSSKKWLAIMDLIAALVTHVDQEHVKEVYNFILPLITSDDQRKQKKAYRILEEICCGKSDGCSGFVLEYLKELEKTLSLSSTVVGPSSKAPRLRCLTGIVRKLTANHRDFLKIILPEVILSTKANSAKAKVAAFNLLEEIGNSYIYFDSCSKEDAIGKYIDFVMSGMAGSSNMISAKLLAIKKLVYIYKDCLPSMLIDNLVVSSVSLLRSKEREITKAALALVKAIISLLERDEMAHHTEALIKNLFVGRRADKNFLRTQTQFILEKLMRKVGYEMLRSLVPEDFKKFVANIHRNLEKRRQSRKSVERANKEPTSKSHYKGGKYNESLLNDSSSDETEEQLQGFAKKKSKSKKYESWILEQSESVVDLLDVKMSKSVSGSRPINVQDKDMSNEGLFSIASNGKLLIDEKKENKAIAGTTSADKILLEGNNKVTSRKRGHQSVNEDGNDNEEFEERNKLTYQPGGGGIHRLLANSCQQNAPKVLKPGTDYKSKKAGGDMKIKGKPDPFAYIPLNRQTLNKRKRAKIDGQFKGVVKATRKSATKVKGKKFFKRRK